MSATLPISQNDRTVTLVTTVAGQVAFPYDFPAQLATDLRVEVALAATPTAWSDLVYAAGDYAVAGLDQAAGGTVTLATGRAIGDLVRISGGATISRTEAITVGGRYSSAQTDRALDRLTIIAQEARRDIDAIGDITADAALAAASAAAAEIAATAAAGSQSAATAAASAAAASAVAAAAVAGHNTYLSRAVAAAAAIPATIATLITLGGAIVGDGHGANYQRVASMPAHFARFQDAAGAWWSVVGPEISIGMVDGTAQAAVDAGWALGLPVRLTGNPGGQARLTIDPVASAAAATSTARMAVIQSALDWVRSCDLRGGAEIDVVISGSGPISVWGQYSNGNFEEPGSTPSISVEMAQATSQTLVGGQIAFAAERIEPVAVSVATGGSGYTYATAVFTGGTSSVPATLAVTVSGGAVTGIVITSPGAWTVKPTGVTISGDGTGATVVSSGIRSATLTEVTVTYPSALPASLAVDQPIAFDGITATTGTGDWIHGAHQVKSWNAGAQTVTFDIQTPGSYAAANSTSITAGTAYFAPVWLAIEGGYTGSVSGLEGFLNSSNSGFVRLNFVHASWVGGKSGAQANKTAPSFLHGGVLAGKAHVRDRSLIAGFPNDAVRSSFGETYLNRLMAGPGIVGTSAITLQNGGEHQLVNSALCGGSAGPIVVGNTTTVAVSGTKFAGGTNVIDCLGEVILGGTCLVTGGSRALYPRQSGRIVILSSLTKVRNSSTAVDPDSGGLVIGLATASIENCTNAGAIGPDQIFAGGGWITKITAAAAAAYLFDAAHMVGCAAGAPEGTVTASIGSVFLQTDGAAGAQLWLKESGTGSTGWVAVASGKRYTSGNLSYTNGTPQTVTHSLGVQPSILQVLAVCQTTEAGYAVGDVIDVTHAVGLRLPTATLTSALSLIPPSGGVAVLDAGTGATATLTPANWRLVVVARP